MSKQGFKFEKTFSVCKLNVEIKHEFIKEIFFLKHFFLLPTVYVIIKAQIIVGL
jgi:hypothetical protein